MSAPVCPYCRTPMEDETALVVCPACSTPHHRECWEENGGCTVFGCAEAPVEEAKVVVSGSELSTPGTMGHSAYASPSTGVPPPPYRPLDSSAEPRPYTPSPSAANSIFGLSEPDRPPFSLTGIEVAPSTDRRMYTLLGFFFGYLGVHNLYANRTSVGIIQLCVSTFTCFLASPAVWIWALVEICKVDRDGDGRPML
ncbi:MAG: TM2 domain-containing protein [Bryobacterales bacterium]|nr:TM2 domain-containing protein [Bryobacterales bacterium]